MSGLFGEPSEVSRGMHAWRACAVGSTGVGWMSRLRMH